MGLHRIGTQARFNATGLLLEEFERKPRDEIVQVKFNMARRALEARPQPLDFEASETTIERLRKHPPKPGLIALASPSPSFAGGLFFKNKSL